MIDARWQAVGVVVFLAGMVTVLRWLWGDAW